MLSCSRPKNYDHSLRTVNYPQVDAALFFFWLHGMSEQMDAVDYQ